MSNRQDTLRAMFNKEGGVIALYHSNKWNSVAELRCHSTQEILTSLTTARAPKIILTYDCDTRPAKEPQADTSDGGVSSTILATMFKSPPLVITACAMNAPKKCGSGAEKWETTEASSSRASRLKSELTDAQTQ